LCQPSFPQPHTLAGLFHPTCKNAPFHLSRKTHIRATFLPQNLVPMPLIQLLQRVYGSKFAVTHRQNSNSFGKKASYIGQQRQLGLRYAMSLNMPHPGPGNRNRASIMTATVFLFAALDQEREYP
jgi:hypothetical protein